MERRDIHRWYQQQLEDERKDSNTWAVMCGVVGFLVGMLTMVPLNF